MTTPPVRQCAWCWLVVDATGAYCIPAPRKFPDATHGICPRCKETVRGEIRASPTLRAALIA